MKTLNIAETTQGGIETYFESLARSTLMQNGFLAVNYHRSIVPLAAKGFRPLNVLILLYTIYFRVGIRHYDVIFLHSSFAGLLRPFLWPLAKWHKIKLVYCSHGWAFDIHYNQAWKNRVYKGIYVWAEKLLTLFTDQVYCISKYEYQSGLDIGLPQRKLTMVWNGAQGSERPRLAVNQDDSVIRLLFVGRLDKQKGLDKFLNALTQLATISTQVELTVIGEPVRNDCPELPELLTKPIHNVCIHSLGWVANNELDQYFAQADVVIVPSLWEGFGLIVAESLRNGTPVLASNAGSLSDMVTEKTGWIFDYKKANSLELLLDRVINQRQFQNIERVECINHFQQNFHEDVMNRHYFDSLRQLG
ncbi:glycosyltransferase family 4 protein [Vibrio sp. LaRot3]|uniref:glycosyltransferase family 4 protein n=1 Tax=Vibrio sp. LaRot3 TaxID=2998829 RepID=UPI0022CDE4C4|nr:glycosyltransferase family 4 protein [Vibrio sp. LaRot3]MDA0148905.1 glycosyltransferase family 4 protein [Vibrio sp. LaRot3]